MQHCSFSVPHVLAEDLAGDKRPKAQKLQMHVYMKFCVCSLGERLAMTHNALLPTGHACSTPEEIKTYCFVVVFCFFLFFLFCFLLCFFLFVCFSLCIQSYFSFPGCMYMHVL